MSDDAMIMAPGFTLNEAMSAIEVRRIMPHLSPVRSQTQSLSLDRRPAYGQWSRNHIYRRCGGDEVDDTV